MRAALHEIDRNAIEPFVERVVAQLRDLAVADQRATRQEQTRSAREVTEALAAPLD